MGRVVRYYKLPGAILAIAPRTGARGPVFDFVFLLEAAFDGDRERAVVHLLVALERVEEAHELFGRVGMRDDQNELAAIFEAAELLND